MKRLFLLVTMVLSIAATSCERNDEIVLLSSQLNPAITNYVETHFPESTITYAIKDTEGANTYEISLSEGFELEFNRKYAITDIKGITKLPDSVIPSKVLTYITTNYANNYIVEWELDRIFQKVELNNGLELVFRTSGEFVRIDY